MTMKISVVPAQGVPTVKTLINMTVQCVQKVKLQTLRAAVAVLNAVWVRKCPQVTYGPFTPAISNA